MRILVTGVARSGTTWVGRAMSRAPQTAYVFEPDNREVDAFAGVAKRGLGIYGFYPVLAPGDRAPAYSLLWDLAFRGGWPDNAALRRARARAQRSRPWVHIHGLTVLARLAARVPPAAPNVVVKSVHCPLALDWVAEHTGATVVVVRRPLLEIVGSWVDRGFQPYPLETVAQVRQRWLEPFGVPAPPVGSHLAHVAWTVGVLDLVVEEAVARHPEWVVVDHPQLCVDPVAEFRAMFARAGLPWGAEVERFLSDSDRPGSGFDPQRVTREQPGRWQRRMSPEDVALVEQVLAGLPRPRRAAEQEATG